MIICYALKIKIVLTFSLPSLSFFSTFSRVYIDNFCYLKNTLAGSCLFNLQVKVHIMLLLAFCRTALSVFDYHKFHQHLLILNVEHTRQMESAPSGPGEYKYIYIYPPCWKS